MTVFAWDGKTLAADRACNIGGIVFDVTKVRAHDGVLFAFAGNGCRFDQLVQWYRAGAEPALYPPRTSDDEGSVMVVIDRVDGRPRVRRFEATGYPIRLEGQFYADGAGRDVALAALHCGKDARFAVELTCKLVSCCGNGVDVLSLDE